MLHLLSVRASIRSCSRVRLADDIDLETKKCVWGLNPQ